MKLDIQDLPTIYAHYRSHYGERDQRMSIMSAVVSGRWEEVDPADERVENRSPNLIQVALEDTAEASSLMPSIRVTPSKPTETAKKKGSAMELMAASYMDLSQAELLNIRMVMDMAAYGFCVGVVLFDDDSGSPIVEWRDPRNTYPEPGYRPGDSIRSCITARTVRLHQLCPEDQAKILAYYGDRDPYAVTNLTRHVVLVEWFSEEDIILAAMVENSVTGMDGKTAYTAIELARTDPPGGICPVVVAQRVSLDNEPRGQFDQVVNVMRAHIRLMGMVLDYADQSVYCLTPEARVLTEDLEYVDVGKLEVGDKLVTFDEFPTDGHYRMWRSGTVTSTGRQMAVAYRVKLADGTEFTATSEHKWLTKPSPQSRTSDWVPTWKLDGLFHSSKGAHVLKPLDLWEHDKSWESGYLAGVLDGEGWLSANNIGSFRMGIAQRDNKCLAMTEKALAHLGFDYSKNVMSSSEDNPGGPVFNLQILGGMREIVRLMMTVRPERLIAKFHALGGADYMGRFKRHEAVQVVECEFLPELVEVVTLSTSTGTLIAEGFAHHNSDVWVKDLIGQMPYGGGSYIQLGAQGAIGRVAPAVSSLSVAQEMDQLVTSIHLGGRWPKSRPGEIDQAIASAKFIEASAGMMNTAIRTYHLLMKRWWEQALRICFKADVEVGRDRTVSGILRNQQFLVERAKSDIDLEARVRVEYGLGLGRDPAQSMVLGIQASQAGFVSKAFVQENFEGITDVAREQRRIDVQQYVDMINAMLLQKLQAGELPERAILEIARKRERGEDILALFEEFVVKPKEAATAQAMPSGLGGEMQVPGLPGAPPGMAGMAPPAPPNLEPQMIARLATQLGDGSFLGTQSGG